MEIQKKISPKNLQTKALKEKKFDDLFDKASNGDVKAKLTLLTKSGRGYEISDEDLDENLDEFLRNRQEGI